MHLRRPFVTVAAFATITVLALLVPHHGAEAQRRPGVPMGFYTTTGLPTLDIEAGSVTSTTSLTESPRFALSALATRAVVKGGKRAWIVGVRGTALSLGNGNGCVITRPGTQGCESRRFTERVAVLTGAAVDVRSTILRLTAGPTLYSVEDSGARLGTQVRFDFAAPRLSGPTPTLFLTRSFLGSESGQGVGITTLGVGFRWVKK